MMTDCMDTWGNDIICSNTPKYRYIQLIAPIDSIALSEISFYEQGKEDKPIQNVKYQPISHRLQRVKSYTWLLTVVLQQVIKAGSTPPKMEIILYGSTWVLPCRSVKFHTSPIPPIIYPKIWILNYSIGIING